MKKIVLTLTLIFTTLATTYAQESPKKSIEYKVITIVESIVPGGAGRSRIIENKTDVNISDFTTERTDGKTSQQKNISRAETKVDEFKESKLLNFYSMFGINFQNIASNDALITSKMNTMAEDGWELAFVTSGVESDGGDTDGKGLFITRMIFKK